MYNSKAFTKFLSIQAKTYGSQYQSYAEEFEQYDDEELVKQIDIYVGYMRHHANDITNDTFKDYMHEVERMFECLKLRQEFRQEIAD